MNGTSTTPVFKVCGMTDEQQIDLAIDAGATHIGLILAPASPRAISAERAAALRGHIGDRAEVVGVFRGQSRDEVVVLAGRVGLDAVQLHGGYTPVDARAVNAAGYPLLWATPVQPDGTWNDEGVVADYLLLDTSKVLKGTGETFGGTGHAFDWSATKRPDVPFLVAGGIGNHNALDAVSALRPNGLDMNSALEDSPGRKNHDQLRALRDTIRLVTEQLPRAATEASNDTGQNTAIPTNSGTTDTENL